MNYSESHHSQLEKTWNCGETLNEEQVYQIIPRMNGQFIKDLFDVTSSSKMKYLEDLPHLRSVFIVQQ